MLIDRERDDAALLAAEDAAIEAAKHPIVEPDLPVGDDLADLIARVTNGQQDVQRGGEG